MIVNPGYISTIIMNIDAPWTTMLTIPWVMHKAHSDIPVYESSAFDADSARLLHDAIVDHPFLVWKSLNHMPGATSANFFSSSLAAALQAAMGTPHTVSPWFRVTKYGSATCFPMHFDFPSHFPDGTISDHTMVLMLDGTGSTTFYSEEITAAALKPILTCTSKCIVFSQKLPHSGIGDNKIILRAELVSNGVAFLHLPHK